MNIKFWMFLFVGLTILTSPNEVNADFILERIKIVRPLSVPNLILNRDRTNLFVSYFGVLTRFLMTDRLDSPNNQRPSIVYFNNFTLYAPTLLGFQGARLVAYHSSHEQVSWDFIDPGQSTIETRQESDEFLCDNNDCELTAVGRDALYVCANSDKEDSKLATLWARSEKAIWRRHVPNAACSSITTDPLTQEVIVWLRLNQDSFQLARLQKETSIGDASWTLRPTSLPSSSLIITSLPLYDSIYCVVRDGLDLKIKKYSLTGKSNSMVEELAELDLMMPEVDLSDTSFIKLFYYQEKETLLVVTSKGVVLRTSLDLTQKTLEMNLTNRKLNLRDAAFDDVRRLLFVVSTSDTSDTPSNAEIMKLAFANCDQYTSCDLCQKNDLCGWGVISGKCVYKTQNNLGETLTTECPRLTQLDPPIMAYGPNKSITLRSTQFVQNPGSPYKCLFGNRSSTAKWTTGKDTILCPLPTDVISTSDTFETRLEVSVVYASTGAFYASNTLTFRLMNCHTATSCVECTTTQVCQWQSAADTCGLPDLTGSFDCSAKITSIAPTSGPISGGTELSVHGLNFAEHLKDSIFLGDIPCLNGTWKDSRTMGCTSGRKLQGGPERVMPKILLNHTLPTPAVVFNPNVIYEYLKEPSIDRFYPVFSPLKGNKTIYIYGNSLNATGRERVYLAGIECHILETSATRITCSSGASLNETEGWVIIQTDASKISSTGVFYYHADTRQPSISALSPTNGPMAGGTNLTLTGDLLDSTLHNVRLGNISCGRVTVVNRTHAFCVSGASDTINPNASLSLATDEGPLVVHNGTGLAFEYRKNPIIHSFSPKVAFFSHPMRILISGNYFASGHGPHPIIYVANSIPCLLKDYNDTQVECLPDPEHLNSINHVGGLGPIVIDVDNARAQSDQPFRFVTDSKPMFFEMNPKQGPMGGGTTLHIQGEFFEKITIQDVQVGMQSCETWDIVNSSAILCVTPGRNSSGTVNVSIVTYDGDSIHGPKHFVYRETPVVQEVYPVYALKEGGTHIKLLGTGFDIAEPVISLNQVKCNVIYHSDGMIECITGAVLAENSTMRVRNTDKSDTELPSGTLALRWDRTVVSVDNPRITFLDRPVIRNVSPLVGPCSGGTLVNISATALNYSSLPVMVQIANVPATAITQHGDFIVARTNRCIDAIGEYEEATKPGEVVLEYDFAKIAYENSLFSYRPDPIVEEASSKHLKPLDTLDIFGQYFDSGTPTVHVAGLPCRVLNYNSSRIRCVLEDIGSEEKPKSFDEGPIVIAIALARARSKFLMRIGEDGGTMTDMTGLQVNQRVSGSTIGITIGIVVSVCVVLVAVAGIAAYIMAKRRNNETLVSRRCNSKLSAEEKARVLFPYQNTVSCGAASKDYLRRIERHLEMILLVEDFDFYQWMFGSFENAFVDTTAFFVYEKGSFFKMLELFTTNELMKKEDSDRIQECLVITGNFCETILPFYAYDYVWTIIGSFIDSITHSGKVMATRGSLIAEDIEARASIEIDMEKTVFWVNLFIKMVTDKSSLKTIQSGLLFQILSIVGGSAQRIYGERARTTAMVHIHLSRFLLPILNYPGRYGIVSGQLTGEVRATLTNVVFIMDRIVLGEEFQPSDGCLVYFNDLIKSKQTELSEFYQRCLREVSPQTMLDASLKAVSRDHLPPLLFEKFMLRSHESFVANSNKLGSLSNSALRLRISNMLKEFPDVLIGN